MRTLLFAGVMMLMTAGIFAENDEKVLKTEINEVTVFLQGAQVQRAGTMYLNPGQYDLVMEDLPLGINPATIQVNGKGSLTILSVGYRTNYLKGQIKSPEVIAMEDSLNLMTQKLNYQNAMLSVYREEEAMILANRAIGGQDNGVSVAELKANADFYRLRLTDIKTKVLEINILLQKISQTISRLQNQLAEQNAKQNVPTGEIVISVNVKAATTASFVVNYNVSNAGWIPMYDIRATDVSSPVTLNFKANVYQTTGENWNRVKMTLSTANPNQNNNCPQLSPWYLYYYENNYSYNTRTSGNAPSAANQDRLAKTEANDESGVVFEQSNQYTVVAEMPTNFEYTIDLPYDVDCDGKVKVVEVKEYSLPAEYRYYCVPKLDTEAFLMARITGWEQYNLLPGESNIFFEGTYVGKSFINPQVTLDTLEISLGRDRGIGIKRTMLKDYTSDKFIGASRKVEKGWEIQIKNNKSREISIVIVDQYPVTTNKDIIIERIEHSGAEVEDATGKLTWRITLKPGETTKLLIRYSVKFPKEQNLILY